MSILTEKEREDVYRYWLKSTTLTNEDGLIQITERAVLEKLAGMELPEPETFEAWNAKQHGDPEEIGFLQALRIAYCSGQDSVNQRQAYAQGAASQLSARPFGYFCEWSAPVGYPKNQRVYEGEPGNGIDDDWNRHPDIYKNLPLYTLKEAK